MTSPARRTETPHGVRIHLEPSHLGPEWIDVTAEHGIVYASSHNQDTWLGLHIEIGTTLVGAPLIVAVDPSEWTETKLEIARIDHDVRAACAKCGCTIAQACMTDHRPCHWAGINLCSGCVEG